MPNNSVKELSQKELNKSLEQSLLRVKKILRKSKWEKEPGTAATWEVEEGRDRAKSSKDAEDDAAIQRDYANDKLENKLLDMEDSDEKDEMAKQPWQEDGKIVPGPGKTETPETAKDEPPLDRKSKVSSKSSSFEKAIKKAMKKAVQKALAKAARGQGQDEDEDEDDEREEQKMKKSVDTEEAEIAINASPFLRKMDRKQKKLEKSISKLEKLVAAHADLSVRNMELTKSIAQQPVPIGSALRKSGYGAPVRPTYDAGNILAKSGQLVRDGKISTFDGMKIEEYANGKRAELPAELTALLQQGARN